MTETARDSSRERRKREMRGRICDAALILIAEQGDINGDHRLAFLAGLLQMQRRIPAPSIPSGDFSDGI